VPRGELLSYEEILRVCRVALELGFRDVRITGGEPLLRRDLPRLVEGIAGLPGLRTLGLTTNGTHLERAAGQLRAAGLRAVNVSLDTLHPSRYERITGRPLLPRVLRGVDRALEAGLEVKLNAVVIRGVNADEVEDLIEFARRRGIEVRFIELMPNLPGLDGFVSNAELLRRLGPRGLRPLGYSPTGPARLYELGGARVGFISPISEPFCHRCNRIRLSATGLLMPCLFSSMALDLRERLRRGCSDEELEEMLREAIRGKPRQGSLREGRECAPLMPRVGG